MTNGAYAYLIDTNVLIYAYDTADPVKQSCAIDVLETLQKTGRGSLTVQVLGEFFVNVTRKPLRPLSPERARQTVLNHARAWPVLDLTAQTLREAVRGVEQHGLSYWDSMIWAAAMEERIPFILTEDQQDRRLIEDVRYFNPFLAGFDVASLA